MPQVSYEQHLASLEGTSNERELHEFWLVLCVISGRIHYPSEALLSQKL